MKFQQSVISWQFFYTKKGSNQKRSLLYEPLSFFSRALFRRCFLRFLGLGWFASRGFQRFGAFLHGFKAIHAAGGINQILLAREKGMALRTNLDFKNFFGRAGFKAVPACAGNKGFIIGGVNVLFHMKKVTIKPKKKQGLRQLSAVSSQ